MSERAVEQISVAPGKVSLAWKRYGVYALLLFVVGAWGGSFVAARALLTATRPGATALSPTLLAATRFLLAAAVFVPLLVRQHLRVRRVRLADVPIFLLLGQLGISVYFWLQYTGVRLTNAGIAAVLVVGLIPLATLVVSGLTLREPLGWKRALALAVGAVGVALVAGQRGVQLSAAGGFLVGALCLIGDALCFAVYSTLIRGLRARYDALTVTASMTATGALGLALLASLTEDWRRLASLSAGQWLALAYLAGICSVLAYLCYNFALTRLEASRAAVWLYLEPPVALVLGTLLLAEAISPATVLGGLAILAGLYVAQRA